MTALALARSPRTCAICGWRPAASVTEWDRRAIPACTRCMSPVAAPSPAVDRDDEAVPLSGRTILLARSLPGLTTQEINEQLGYIGAGFETERNTVCNSLLRGVRDGYLVADDSEGRFKRRHYRGPRAWTGQRMGPGIAARSRRRAAR